MHWSVQCWNNCNCNCSRSGEKQTQHCLIHQYHRLSQSHVFTSLWHWFMATRCLNVTLGHLHAADDLLRGSRVSKHSEKNKDFWWTLMILHGCGCWNFRILQDTLSILRYTEYTPNSSIHLLFPLAKCRWRTSCYPVLRALVVFCPTGW